MNQIDSGLQAWRHLTNHNRMLEFQALGLGADAPMTPGEVEVAFFGSSAFRVTTPIGMTLMIDPWRNIMLTERKRVPQQEVVQTRIMPCPCRAA